MTPLQHIGATARRSRIVSRRDIELFSQMTGDMNPLHYDEHVAGRSRFGGIIVQGGDLRPAERGGGRGSCPAPAPCSSTPTGATWPSVRPGDEIVAEVEVIGLRPDKPVVTLRTTVTGPGRHRARRAGRHPE